MATTPPTFSKGHLQRSAPLLRIVNGHEGQHSRFAQATAPVYTGQTILSGMVMSQVWESARSAYAWKPGITANAPAFVALNDSHDPDVVASQQFIGIPLNAGFNFETGHVVIGTLANWDANARVSAFPVDDADAGKFKLAASTETILGTLMIPHKDGLLDVTARYPEVVRTNNKVQVARIAANHSIGVVVA